MNLIFFIIVFIVLFVLLEIVKKISNIPCEYSRKIAHIFSAVVIVFLPYFLDKVQLIFLAVFFIILLLISKKAQILKSIHSVERKTWGEIFLPAGSIIAALLFLPANLAAFQFGILVMGISDGLGGIIGLQLGKHQITWLRNGKTWEGTLTFFIITFALFILYFTSPMLGGLVIAFLLTLLEAVLNRGLDNLLIPIVAGYLIILIP